MSKYTYPDYNNCAVVTIDTQNDFSLPGAVAEIAGTVNVLPHMKLILDACRSRDIPIFHVIRFPLKVANTFGLYYLVAQPKLAHGVQPKSSISKDAQSIIGKVDVFRGKI